MNVKEFFGKLFSPYLCFHLLAMAAVVILIVVGINVGLSIYTKHGVGIPVPDLKDMDYNKADQLLQQDGLKIAVSDSGYVKTLPANCILAQSPDYGTKVKEGRVIYVTVNSPSSPTIEIPDIVDNSSYREAEAKLKSLGFKVLPAKKVAGEKDWVYGILCRGRRVANGDRISIEYPLTLMVGKGTYDDQDVDINYVGPDAGYGNETQSGGDVDDFQEVTAP